MDLARSVCPYGRKQVPIQIRVRILELSTVSCEKYGSSAMPVSHTNNIAFVERQAAWFRIEYAVGILASTV